jgi:hypothetical protein
MMTPLERFSCFFASLCHDAGHPGRTNPFVTKERGYFNKTYGDDSPLEKHHVSIMHALIQQNATDLLGGLGAEDRAKVVETAEMLILATDMARHGEIMKAVGEGLLEDKEADPVVRKTLLMKTLMKAADINNVQRPWDSHERWCSVLHEEFHAQAAAEKANGWPVSPPPVDPSADVTGGQVFFIGQIARPLCNVLRTMLPECQQQYDCLDNNVSTWTRINAKKKERVAKMEEAKEKGEAAEAAESNGAAAAASNGGTVAAPTAEMYDKHIGRMDESIARLRSALERVERVEAGLHESK